MKIFTVFLTLSALFLVGSAQQLQPLSSFKGMSVHNEFSDFKVYPPYNIYVSAHSDATSALQQISVVTESGTKTLFELKQNLQASGEITGYPVLKPAYLTTTLSDNDLKRLNGVIYISSSKQYADNTFHVYGVSKSQNINLQALGKVDTTILFLNTNMGTNPYKSTIISQWKQDSTALAYLYAGFPQDTAEGKNTQIFSNPMHTDKADLYFANVEKFSLTLVAFYLKTYRGVNFRIEPGYSSIDSSTTTDVTTTGFYMKPLEKDDSTITVNIKRDTRFSGASGANVIGNLTTGGMVTVGFYEGASKYEDSAAPNPFCSPWSIPYILQNMKIWSTSSNPKNGQYFVQYFIARAIGSGTTSRPGQTTTRSSGTVQFFVSVASLMILWL
uniref:CUB_2 domain-containing protein n=1 Tax=Caenorhabditis elegans TaxID=6239 RepID=Q6EZG8_CAEEL|eukprot:NP_001024315.1 Uncharacterized protein CELE_ZK6.11 [Caenorhabditis elegans]